MNEKDLLVRYQKALLELVYSTDTEIRNSYQEWVDLAEEIDGLKELYDLALAEKSRVRS